jgi:hypothetical protein
MIEGIWDDLPIEFNVLSQSTGECLMGFPSLFFSLPEVLPDGRHLYSLKNDELGEIGRIIISKRPGSRSAIEFNLSETEKEEPIPEEMAASMGMQLRPPLEYSTRVERIRKEREELTRRRKDFLEEMESILIKLLVPGWDKRQKEKRGRRSYVDKAEKLQALKDWDKLTSGDRPSQADWLENRFGTNPSGLNVSPSTFRGWRRLKK